MDAPQKAVLLVGDTHEVQAHERGTPELEAASAIRLVQRIEALLERAGGKVLTTPVLLVPRQLDAPVDDL